MSTEAYMPAENIEPIEQQAFAEIDSVGLYLREIGRTALLKGEEEVELAREIESGLLAHQILYLRDAEDMDVAKKELQNYMYEVKCERYKVYAVRKPHPENEPLAAQEAGEVADFVERLANDNSIENSELQTLAQIGDRAKRHLVQANLRLVVNIAKRYCGRGMSFEDLIQEGNLGLYRATETFDYTKGFKFSTHAVWGIVQRLTAALAEESRVIRLPEHVHLKARKINDAEQEFMQRLGRNPTLEELAAAVDMLPEKVAEWRDAARSTLSLDAPACAESGDTIGEVFAESVAVVNEQEFERKPTKRQEKIREVMAGLRDRDQLILTRVFGLDDAGSKTYKEVGEELHLTAARVSHIIMRLKKTLASSSVLQECVSYDVVSGNPRRK